MNINNIYKNKIAVIGLGYVGLPLALKFGEKFNVIAFDKEKKRIDTLNKNIDINSELTKKDFTRSKKIFFTNNEKNIKDSNVYIIAVPTPLKKNNKPDFSFLKIASKTVGKYLKSKDIVIYESTVYPGATEEICVPILKKYSNLNYKNNELNDYKLKNYFYCGYSPERVNPGDKNRTIEKIVKITSGSNHFASLFVDKLYKSIIKAGTHLVSSIKVAEAAKIIENTQRDLNIALINELSIIFNKLDLNTNEILKAANTKWNFINYEPGLVGGHCISVDPYYLTHKSIEMGYNPNIILSGRKTNDSMHKYIIKKIDEISKIHLKKLNIKILLMGLTFKENCSDLRNSKVFDLYKGLLKNYNVDIYDPIANYEEVKKKYKMAPKVKIIKNKYDIIILSVPHNYFKKIGIKKIKTYLKGNKKLIIDLKSMFEKNHSIFSL